MHFHLPKPLHGWREFVGEIAIIVIGVLIALVAEQLVETAHWNHQVETFRDVVHREVANDLGTYQFRIKQSGCVKRRLDDLELWLASLRAGQPRKLERPIGAPRSQSLEKSVWESRDANLVSHMPISERMALGQLYDYFDNNEAHRLDERETWLTLGEFDGAVNLENRDLMRLRGLISRARFRDQRMTYNTMIYLRDAAALGIKPREDPDFSSYDPVFCNSIFTSGEKKN